MGQDEIYLQVISASGEGSEKKYAKRVLRLLKRGKHWVLVTLLLGNVITNETLPIVLDRSLGGGWPAVLGSTVLIGKPCRVQQNEPPLTFCSHLWRNRSSIGLCSLRLTDRLLDGTLRSGLDVHSITGGLAHCQITRSASRRGSWDGVQKGRPENPCISAQVVRRHRPKAERG